MSTANAAPTAVAAIMTAGANHFGGLLRPSLILISQDLASARFDELAHERRLLLRAAISGDGRCSCRVGTRERLNRRGNEADPSKRLLLGEIYRTPKLDGR
jgi:hypothetical protein